MNKIARNILLPILIFVISLGFRLYHLPERAIFTADEEYQATYAQTIVNDLHPVWIGVSAAGTGFYLGPGWTYLTAGLLKINSDPLILNYFSAVLGSLTVIAFFFLTRKYYGNLVAITSSIFLACSPWVVAADQRYWNPSTVILLTIMFFFGALGLRKHQFASIAIMFAFGALWHVHLSLVPIGLLSIFLLIFAITKKQISMRWTISSVVVYLLLISPLIVFDYNKNWSNLLTPIRIIQGIGHDQKQSFNLPSNIYILTQTMSRAWYLNPGNSFLAEVRPECTGINLATLPSSGLIWLSWIPILGYLLIRIPKKREFLQDLPMVFLLTSIIGFCLYPGAVVGYYALSIIPLYFLVTALFLGELTKLKAIYLSLALIYVLVSFWTIYNGSNLFGLSVKRDLIKNTISQLPSNATFKLVEGGTCFRFGGWRYLFATYGRTPSQSSADVDLGWLYPKMMSTDPPQYTIIVGADRELPPIDPTQQNITTGGYRSITIINRETN